MRVLSILPNPLSLSLSLSPTVLSSSTALLPSNRASLSPPAPILAAIRRRVAVRAAVLAAEAPYPFLFREQQRSEAPPLMYPSLKLRRCCLVGPNGIGKSTILKLISGELQPSSGTVFRSAKVRIAVFNQHHVDGLDLFSNPLLYMMRCFPGVPEQKLRGHLGSLGITGNLALQPMYTLSGGQKSRVAFVKITFKKPHILLLDEPSNHLVCYIAAAVSHSCYPSWMPNLIMDIAMMCSQLLQCLAVIAFVGGEDPEQTEKSMHIMWQVAHPKLGANVCILAISLIQNILILNRAALKSKEEFGTTYLAPVAMLLSMRQLEECVMNLW
ncbi:uncharacterized protein LOC131025858 [Salvia miltiorrhiza]|uniref:uncharacterized protein LOC131025858 n=1 Tax=Salvia miltiorrhiza TaxID=226208 RepID=UPI0025AC92AE|nr:uncharacterized protein LOC131025858 [Salvia miltiorrhiza]